MALKQLFYLISFVFLTEAMRNGDVQLSRGHQGLLSVYYNGSYGPVCDDGGANANLGNVVCRNLGRSFISASSDQSGSTSKFYLDEVICSGNESNLDACRHNPWMSHNCASSEHISVICSTGQLPCYRDRPLPCSQICNDGIGDAYTCSCRPGYQLSSDSHTCENIDECLSSPCSHACVDTPGSFRCECPYYLRLDTDGRTCIPDGYTLVCDSYQMTISMDKNHFYYLPPSLHLNQNTRDCQSTNTATHYILTTQYDKCGTTHQRSGDSIIYSNAVRSQPVSQGGLHFFDDINIPFKCQHLIKQQQILSQGFNPISSQLQLDIQESGLFHISMNIYDDPEFSSIHTSNNIRQGQPVRAGLRVQQSGSDLSVVPSACKAQSSAGAAEHQLISVGKPTRGIRVSSVNSESFRFEYLVFKFKGYGDSVKLVCKSDISVDVSNSEVNSTVPSYLANLPTVTLNESSASLTCSPTQFRLTVDKSKFNPAKLRPMNPQCQGYEWKEVNGRFRFIIPLQNCGATLEEDDGKVLYTNSLVYREDNSSNVLYYSGVNFTFTCSYPLHDASYLNSLTYTVTSDDYIVSVKNPQPVPIDVQFNLFNDATFKKMIRTGATVSVAEGRKLFGSIEIKSSDSQLKVALNTCKLTPTSNINDTVFHTILQNGCPTAYGSSILSNSQFSLPTLSFGAERSRKPGKVFLHCSIRVCGAWNIGSCRRNCGSRTVADAFGKRDLADDQWVVSGPYSMA